MLPLIQIAVVRSRFYRETNDRYNLSKHNALEWQEDF